MSFKPQEEEIKKLKDTIKEEVKEVFEKNMSIFDMDIPENNDRKTAQLIYTVMQESMHELELKIQSGAYDLF